ncbi:TetR family transcriptional regulator [Streptomyces sp. MMG1533]|uniref:TetR/AcrR family transcriptional regulator n=1 Tax=Streptomyces sp. MMG1533 TaxID=1415546 RepID=UPI0006AE57EC|nr:TetR/AcrR family transcriptional regulator [Streptomyces sp. MMG1533]KOU68039.1 TetR family transcriptional regulator [Streptomyces sp. MMG1533]
MANESAAGPDRSGDRGRPARLSRERVLAAALELVDREGLSALSMRRLGADLGVEAMSLYRYAPGKEALVDGLVEALYLQLEDRLDQAPVPTAAPAAEPAAGDFEQRAELQRIALATYQVCLDHAQVAPLLSTRMMAVPLARRPLPVLRDHERVLTLLRDAGLDEAQSATVLRAFTAWVLGYMSVELRAMVDNPDEPDPAFRFGLHRLPAQDLPRLRESTPTLAERGGPEGLAAGLDALLDRFAGPHE